MVIVLCSFTQTYYFNLKLKKVLHFKNHNSLNERTCVEIHWFYYICLFVLHLYYRLKDDTKPLKEDPVFKSTDSTGHGKNQVSPAT